MNKKSKALWFFFGFIAGGMFFVTPAQPKKAVQEPEKVVIEPTKSDDIKDFYYRTYMKGCSDDTIANTRLCDCMYKHIVDEVGFEKMLKIAENLKTGETPPEYTRAAIACVK